MELEMPKGSWFTATAVMLLVLLASCSGPDARELMRESYRACRSAESGYYEITRYQAMRFPRLKDGWQTDSSYYSGHFSILPGDSLYAARFHSRQYVEGRITGGTLYTGEQLLQYALLDSSGRILSTAPASEWIKNIAANVPVFDPFIDKAHYPLPTDAALNDPLNTFELIGEETISGIACYHLRMNSYAANDGIEQGSRLRTEYNYWIGKQDALPWQYDVAIDMLVGRDTLNKFNRTLLTHFRRETKQTDPQLQLSSIPSFISLETYQPRQEQRPELLPTGSMAPSWNLSSLEGEELQLQDLKGKLVLMDFFFKACYPCQKAFPGLQDLHQRYRDQGLVVVGIDPFTLEQEKGIDALLSKYGLTYPVMFGAKDVVEAYHVTSYPTIYLLDKNGRIIYVKTGYHEGYEAVLEEIIKEHL